MKCPNGVICVDRLNLFFIIVLAIVIFYGVNKQMFFNIYTKNLNEQSMNTKLLNELKSSNIQLQKEQNEIKETQRKEILEMHKSYREQIKKTSVIQQKSIDIHQKAIDSQQKNKGVPINMPTRGETEDYKQIGILSKNSINNTTSKPGDNADSVILPLYGKQCYRRSQNWFYYTMSNNFNSMKIPITINGYDCTDDRGCKELNDGDTVTIPSYNGVFTCKIYKNEKMRYIPYVY